MHPAWPELRKRAEELMEAEFLRLARMMAKGKAPDAERVAWTRGLFAGFKMLLDDPNIQVRTLELAYQSELNGRGSQ